MNNITIGGTLTRDAELKFLPNGDPILNFSVADNQSGRDKPAIFWSASLFGKRAESLAQYLLKSQQVTVSGTLSKREWTDNQGNKREAMDLRVNDVLLQGGRPQGQQEASQQRQAAKSAGKPSSGGGAAFDDLEDVPFNSLPRRALTSL